ncbi:GlcG/HbpS family heme-binding protein [Mucilaginibacter lappiensis]|uniref:GlcG/HbpS family heme-binding protein n=1 Tax=Mucilaginibacter lappiensis TaxID=354630 RepID=UPI003D2246B6
MNITLKQAELAIQAAKERASQLGTLMNIAIVDSGVNLVAFVRMDDAWIGSIDIALRKAKTASYFNMESGEIGKLSQPGGQGWQIEHSNGGLITFPGGVPITNTTGQIIGAIGVSGSTVEHDQAVARAGAKAVK